MHPLPKKLELITQKHELIQSNVKFRLSELSFFHQVGF